MCSNDQKLVLLECTERKAQYILKEEKALSDNMLGHTFTTNNSYIIEFHKENSDSSLFFQLHVEPGVRFDKVNPGWKGTDINVGKQIHEASGT